MSIKEGMRGDEVASWQRVLNTAGIEVVVDGIFGPETLAATKALQERLGVEADGIVGPSTFAAARAAYPSAFVALVDGPRPLRLFPFIILGGAVLLFLYARRRDKRGK